MYLIDGGKLLMQMMHKFHYELPDGCNNPLYGDVMEVIEDAPLIEAEPVRHGRWEDKPTGAYGRYQSWCTACGKHSGIGGIESNRHKPYCPNCGAKMRLEE